MKFIRTRVLVASALALGIGLVLGLNGAEAAPVTHTYEVNIRRCPDRGANVDLNFGGGVAGLEHATQQLVDSTVYAMRHPGLTKQVRLVRYPSNTVAAELLGAYNVKCH